MSFWVISGIVGGLAAIVLALAMIRARSADNNADFDLRVYKDQLAEVERDLIRRVISPEEAERSRIEVSRRLLEADKAAQSGATNVATRVGVVVSGAVAVAVFGAAFLLYGSLGAPNYADLPLATRIEMSDAARAGRPSQTVVEAEIGVVEINPNADPRHLELMEKLREALETRPDDLQGHVLLAHNEAELGNFVAAHKAQARVLAIKAHSVQAGDYADYADLLVLAAGGYVSPEAEDALTKALRLDPRNGTARYYSGLMFAQSGRPDMAFRLWRPLLDDSPPDAPWVAPVRQQIEQVAADAGVRYTPPALAAPLAGPDADDIAAASEMTAEDRDVMIRGMVEQLSDRLASEGGTPQEWARLISALGVLGEKERASLIWAEAQEVFASAPSALEALRAAAEQAGVAQ